MSAEIPTSSLPQKRPGVTFHRSFPLSRAAIGQVLQAAKIVTVSGPVSRPLLSDDIRKLTTLGSVYVEAVPRYCRAAGLLDAASYLTRFGELVIEHDPFLDQPTTQWLMHYHLSAPQGPGPLFWHELVKDLLLPGSEFTSEDVAAQISSHYMRVEREPLAERSSNTTARVFLGTYTQPEGLGRLGILRKHPDGRYEVLAPIPPSSWVLGYALLDTWQAEFADRLTVNLSSILSRQGVADLLFMSRGQADAALGELQAAGYVEVHHVAEPYQVALVSQDSESLLRRMYGLDHPA